MELSQETHIAVARRIELKSIRLRSDPDKESDREFADFIESISLSGEEMAAFLATPALSVPEVKRLFARRQS